MNISARERMALARTLRDIKTAKDSDYASAVIHPLLWEAPHDVLESLACELETEAIAERLEQRQVVIDELADE